MENKFKTIHENNVQINPFSIENQVKSQMESLRYKVKNLQRYYNSVEHGCPIMEEYEYGEYIKLEDVLKLFGAENGI